MPLRALTARRPWQGRRVVLGVSGGIAAYKSVQLARDLTRLGCEVDVVLTRAAKRFIGALTFEALTGRPVLTELFSAAGAARHIALGREADVVCVAPATADLIARAAQGRADDLLTTTLLATTAPVVICPAMNDRMFAHAQTGANVRHLREVLGYRVVGPAEGALAFGEGEGPGRMAEPEEIVEYVGRELGRDPRLDGRTVVVTAGPTREALDPVRYVGNRSSGRMGYALASAAWRRGCDVTLVSGPSALSTPPGVETVRVETAMEMRDAAMESTPGADLVFLAAAVADYRPEEPRDRKVKRSAEGNRLSIPLVANPDIAVEVGTRRKRGSVVVGFALETEDLLDNARRKMEAKGFDLIVANPATEPDAGFEGRTNRVTLLAPGTTPEELPLMSKHEVAEVLMDRVATMLEGGGA